MDFLDHVALLDFLVKKESREIPKSVMWNSTGKSKTSP
jgi:hypothetical protein